MMAVVVGAAAAAAAVLAAALGLKQTRIAPVCTLWMTSSLSDDCFNPTTTYLMATRPPVKWGVRARREVP